jgi:hypothetical protein
MTDDMRIKGPGLEAVNARAFETVDVPAADAISLEAFGDVAAFKRSVDTLDIDRLA